MKALRAILFLIMLLVSQCAWAARGTILYVPLDDRPVCKDYSVETMRAAGWSVEIPPEEFIASHRKVGDSEKLFAWLESKIPESVAVVASSDALIYGGLVGSRTHNLPMDVLQARAERLLSLKAKYGDKKIYVFTTIMRSPKASNGVEEPHYYKLLGPKIFRLGELEDKNDLQVIKRKELRELQSLRLDIPEEIQNDLYTRRKNNIKVTELLLHGVESGEFDYMLIGRDDTAQFSQAHREARQMDILVSELPSGRIRFLAGADQLGLLLMTRVGNRLQHELPMVVTTYAAGKGGKTIPSYEDAEFSKTVFEHIFAIGAFPIRDIKKADLVLAINTPKNGTTLEAGNTRNSITDKNSNSEANAFVKKVKNYVKEGKNVAVIDIKYSNGADNALVHNLFDKKVAFDLASYAGWNTASNSLGNALAQGLLVDKMTKVDKKSLLEKRYLDDWAYQSNVRSKTYLDIIWPNKWNGELLKPVQKVQAQQYITREMKGFARPYLGEVVDAYSYTLPWSRMFEVKVEKTDAN